MVPLPRSDRVEVTIVGEACAEGPLQEAGNLLLRASSILLAGVETVMIAASLMSCLMRRVPNIMQVDARHVPETVRTVLPRSKNNSPP